MYTARRYRSFESARISRRHFWPALPFTYLEDVYDMGIFFNVVSDGDRTASYIFFNLFNPIRNLVISVGIRCAVDDEYATKIKESLILITSVNVPAGAAAKRCPISSGQCRKMDQGRHFAVILALKHQQSRSSSFSQNSHQDGAVTVQ